ncbi:MAG TPA: ABC transporter substrate-binding protein [Polyangia bacterium]
MKIGRFSSTGASIVLACLVAATAGCHRGKANRATSGATDGLSGAADTKKLAELLSPTPPPLPPLLPAPEEVNADPHLSRGGTGGTLKVHLEAEPTHLDPLVEVDASALQVVSGLVYETLLECPSPGVAGPLRPALAESWQVSPDGLRVALRLRPGVKWHDGHAFGALDVQATLEPLLLTRGNGSQLLRASLQDVASVEISSDNIVRLLLKRPSDFALRALCDIPVLPEHLLRGPKPAPATLARQPVGTGPFRFAGWERGKRIRLERSPTYWGKPSPLDDITFEIDGDGAQALTRTRRGDIDVLPRILPVHYPDQVDPSTLHGQLTVWRMDSDRWAYLGVNHRRPPLGDARFRQALSALWDRAHFSRTLHGGLAQAISAFPPVASPLPPSGRAAASAALEAAGYRDTDADGVRELNGKAIRVSLLVVGGGRTAATEARGFVLEARKVGVLIDTVVVDAATMMARVRKGDFELALMAWQGSPNEDPGLQFGSGGPFNYWGYRSAELDADLEALRRADDGARPARLAAVAEVLARDQPVVFLYRFDIAALISRRVHDISAVADRLDLRRVWVEP